MRNLLSPAFNDRINKIQKEGFVIHRKLEVRTACKNYYLHKIGKCVHNAENSIRSILALKFPDKLAKVIEEDNRS
jgi:hypothetical protein